MQTLPPPPAAAGPPSRLRSLRRSAPAASTPSRGDGAPSTNGGASRRLVSVLQRLGALLRFVVLAAIVAVHFACDLPPAVPAEGPVVLGSDPSAGEVGVDRLAPLVIFFDRALHPSVIHRGTVSLQSGTRSVFVSPVFDPVGSELRVLLPAPLDPDVVYRLRVAAVRDLERNFLAAPYEVAFTTGERADGAAAPSLTFADVAPIFASCARGGCHAAEDPALGLDLSSGEAVRRTAIGVAAEQVRVGTMADEPWRVLTVLEGLPRVEVFGGVGAPARSYLLYKVLGGTHIRGDRMPPAPDAELTSAELARLSEWIFQGAPTQ